MMNFLVRAELLETIKDQDLLFWEFDGDMDGKIYVEDFFEYFL